MNYKVLARKWRPQNFKDVVGQEHVIIPIINSLKNNNIHHAYLFSGSHGIGKTTIARILAKALNCKTGITIDPCCQCKNCLEIENGKYIDLIEIDGASKTKIEDIRELINNIQYSPIISRFKIYLIDEIHMLSRYSFNALLKTLEEPPIHVKFFLATTDPKKIPITILSRCLHFHLKKLNISQISNKLKLILNAEQINNDFNVCNLIAQASNGSLRDALNLTNKAIAFGKKQITSKLIYQILGIISDEHALSIIENIFYKNGKKIFTLIEYFVFHNYELENILIKILSLIHKITILQITQINLENNSMILNKKIHLLANSIPSNILQSYYQIFLTGHKELDYAPNKQIGIEMIILKALTINDNNNIINNK